jgi:VanZ family protein
VQHINRVKFITAMPFFLATVAIFIASHQSKIEIPNVNIWDFDKILHLIAYFVYTILLMIYLNGNFDLTKGKILLITFGIATVFAISDEIHQSFIPGRTASVYDFLADLIGIALAMFFHRKVPKIIEKIGLLAK